MPGISRFNDAGDNNIIVACAGYVQSSFEYIKQCIEHPSATASSLCSYTLLPSASPEAKAAAEEEQTWDMCSLLPPAPPPSSCALVLYTTYSVGWMFVTHFVNEDMAAIIILMM